MEISSQKLCGTVKCDLGHMHKDTVECIMDFNVIDNNNNNNNR